jgi:hypothetical protein
MWRAEAELLEVRLQLFDMGNAYHLQRPLLQRMLHKEAAETATAAETKSGRSEP